MAAERAPGTALVISHSARPPWQPHCFSNTPSPLPLQGLCICYLFSLESSCTSSLQGWLLFIQTSAHLPPPWREICPDHLQSHDHLHLRVTTTFHCAVCLPSEPSQYLTLCFCWLASEISCLFCLKVKSTRAEASLDCRSLLFACPPTSCLSYCPLFSPTQWEGSCWIQVRSCLSSTQNPPRLLATLASFQLLSSS